jgi:hypothetical protein
MTIENAKKPSSGTAWLVWGAVFLLLGIASILRIVFTSAGSRQYGGNAQLDGTIQAITIVAAAAFIGAAVAFLLIGFGKRRRFGNGR